MKQVSATEAKQRFAVLLEEAQREPVEIRRHDRAVAVLLSTRDFERLRSLNIAEFQRFCDRVGEDAARRGLDKAALAAILADDGKARRAGRRR
jgi:prevent-host-death family protein